MDIHQRILQLCKERNWTLYKIAHEAGISEATVYGWFNENHFTPSRNSIEDICAAFQISLATFYNDIDLDNLSTPNNLLPMATFIFYTTGSLNIQRLIAVFALIFSKNKICFKIPRRKKSIAYKLLFLQKQYD